MSTELENKDLTSNDANSPVSDSAEHDMWKLLDKINTIMWESYMIKDYPFGRKEGRKIMEVLEQWAERH